MLEVRPIQEKTLQEEYCALCKIEYDADCLAYAAYVDETPVGICQFSLAGGIGNIIDIAPAPMTDDFEAMFIMGRETLNFIDLCGIHFAKCRATAGDFSLIKSLGFKQDENGEYVMDLTDEFTKEHCKG